MCVCVYNHSVTKEMKSCLVTKEINLEGIILSKISQTERRTPYDSLVWNIKNKISEDKPNRKNRNKHIGTEKRVVVAAEGRVCRAE